jgi:hypothetical protein
MHPDHKESSSTKSHFPWCHELLSYHIISVGGLESPKSLKPLKNYLSQFGKIVWMRVFPNVQAPGGFAHVILDRPEAYKDLFSKASHNFEGLNLRIKMWRKPVDGCSYDSEMNERKVFVKNLASFITEKHLFDHFQHFGSIDAVELQDSNLSESSRKIGYITFSSKHAAEHVLQTPNHIIRKNKVKCRRYCTDKKEADWLGSIIIPNQPPVNFQGVQAPGISGLPNINLYKVYKRGKKKFDKMQMDTGAKEASSNSLSNGSLNHLNQPSSLSNTNSLKTSIHKTSDPINACDKPMTPNNPKTDDSQPRYHSHPELSVCTGINYFRRPIFIQYYTVIGKY